MGDENKGYSKISENKSNGNERLDIYNTDGHPVPGDNHSSFHAQRDSDGKTDITFNNRETGEKSSASCYLTTACMKTTKENFDDDCDELMTLRWFRDTFVSTYDIQHYYKVAPLIVEKINTIKNNERIYKYIYKYIILACVNAIKKGDYTTAYNKYKNSILSLETHFLNEDSKKEKSFVKKHNKYR